ncbi:helicase C-terminal domain-containing protein [Apiospora marii]|uniref:ATP-dependent DNA helicase CHL1 n=1 Tax=Apiospora marii TaxID=335849 RepID=A0ABR1T139_9PEZI
MAGTAKDLDLGLDQVTEGIKKVDFHHPYTPYDVQEQFMRSVYDVLETGDGQVGILESPTGTGKSLSLICAALTWLRNHKQATFESSVEDAAKQFKDEPDWVVDMMLKRKKDEVIKKWEEREARLEAVRAREKAMEIRTTKRRRLNDQATDPDGDHEPDEDEWLLDERDEDGAQGGESSNYSKDTRALMEKLGMMPKRDAEEEDGADQELKIYYTSRTHSQLTQFIEELRRPTFPPSIPEAMISKDNASEPEIVKHVPLSSRQRLCINPAVSRLGSVQAINDRCSELQQSNSKSKCQFVPNPDKLTQTHQFRDHALAAIPDIEDMFELGKKLSICPYYASRTAIPGAEIITLPYPLLLQKTARDALGIKLEGNVVIIDEAHNIMDAVANVYASEISLSELRRARQMLGVYVKKFGKKLKGENRVMVAQVARVIDGLSNWLDGALKLKMQGDQGIVDSNNLLKSKGADQINLFKLIQYVQESKLAYKIEGYVAHTEQDPKNPSPRSSSSPVLHTLVSFLVSLTNLSTEGRIFYNKTTPAAATKEQQQPDIKLSYLLLSPTHAFSSVASAARAVILAGGTMSPFDDYTAHLFPHLDRAKVTTLSCGHVIPSSSLCVWTLASARPGLDFEFSFSKRSDKRMIHELGIAILNICTAVPDGVVVFFPSYGYLEEVVAVWGGGGAEPQKQENNTAPPSVWSRLQSKKAVFRESKGGSSDDVLAQYSEAILGSDSGEASKPASQQRKTSGALLLSVVGGKMSEGINFSDRLGRCVVIVGLPYPNINSPDWKARIEYIETTTTNRLLSAPANNDNNTDPSTSSDEKKPPAPPPLSKADATAQAKDAARDFYENACMRAVNQSIGRAIRHRGDYAAIVLLDRRFGAERIRRKLPGWIRAGMGEGGEGAGALGQLMGKLNGFFREKKMMKEGAESRT